MAISFEWSNFSCKHKKKTRNRKVSKKRFGLKGSEITFTFNLGTDTTPPFHHLAQTALAGSPPISATMLTVSLTKLSFHWAGWFVTQVKKRSVNRLRRNEMQNDIGHRRVVHPPKTSSNFFLSYPPMTSLSSSKSLSGAFSADPIFLHQFSMPLN